MIDIDFTVIEFLLQSPICMVEYPSLKPKTYIHEDGQPTRPVTALQHVSITHQSRNLYKGCAKKQKDILNIHVHINLRELIFFHKKIY